MVDGQPGRRRSAGLSIFLFIVTLGIYWFVWMYKAFGEFGRHRGTDLKVGKWVGILAVLWVVLASLAIVALVTEAPPEPGARPPRFLDDAIRQQIANDQRPVALAGSAVAIVFYILQSIFLARVSHAVQAASRPHVQYQGVAALAVWFNVLDAIVQLPAIDRASFWLLFLASLAALVLAIMWVVQVQKMLNAYWDQLYWGGPAPLSREGAYRAALSPTAEGVPGEPARWLPAPPLADPPEVARERAFPCPRCGTPATVRYVPGTATPVECQGCGERGTIA